LDSEAVGDARVLPFPFDFETATVDPPRLLQIDPVSFQPNLGWEREELR
jgi:hypothetical protein